MTTPLPLSPVVARAVSAASAAALAVALSAAVSTTASADPQSVTPIGSESDFRSAIADLNNTCDSGPHTLTVEASFEVSDPDTDGQVEYTCGEDLVIRGDGNVSISLADDAPPQGFLHVTGVPGAGVTLDSLTIEGFATEGSGAVLNTTGPVTVVNSVLQSNSANTAGGAIHTNVSNATVTVDQSVIRDNSTVTSNEAGGAIYSNGKVTITDSHFEGNESTHRGGAVYSRGDVVVDSSSFVDNVALREGGALYGSDGSVTVTNSTLMGNDANTQGSSIYVWSNTESLGVMLMHAVVVSPEGSDTSVLGFSGDQSHSFGVSGSILDTPDADLCYTSEPFAVKATFNTWVNTDDCVNTGTGVIVDLDGSVEMDVISVLGSRAFQAAPAADAVTVNSVSGGSCVLDEDARGVERPAGDACDMGPIERLTFDDVATDHVFVNAIEWLAGSGVSTGYDDGTFRPGSAVSRMAMAAFLQRFVEPDFTEDLDHSFSDVADGHPFEAEIAWIADRDISTGYSDGTYRPSAPVTRQAMAAFLYRAAGEPEFTAPATASFSDVPTDHPFFHEVEWMASTQITTGYTDGTFRGTSQVSRMAMAAFLQRMHEYLAP